MTLDRLIELQKDQLKRYRSLKLSCDSCIDNEVIEAQELVIELLVNFKELGLIPDLWMKGVDRKCTK